MTDKSTEQSPDFDKLPSPAVDASEPSEVKTFGHADMATVESQDVALNPNSFLFSIGWWKNALLTSWLFARHCAVAASMFTLACVVMIIGSWQGLSGVPHEMTRIESLIAPALIVLSTGCTAIILICWALGVWLVKLTAFCAACIEVPITDKTLDRSRTLAAQASAVEMIWHKKAYLAKFWLYISLFISPLIAMLAFYCAAKILLSASTYGEIIKIPPGINAALIGSAAFLGLVVSEISLVALAVSSRSNLEALKATKLALKLSFKLFVPGVLITAFVTFLNVSFSLSSSSVSLAQSRVDILNARERRPDYDRDTLAGPEQCRTLDFTLTPITELVRRQLSLTEELTSCSSRCSSMGDFVTDQHFIKVANDPFCNAESTLQSLRNLSGKFSLCLGGTQTSDVPDISAAGVNAEMRRLTPCTDAEALVEGRAITADSIPVSPLGIVLTYSCHSCLLESRSRHSN